MTLTTDRAPYEQAAEENAYPVDLLITHTIENTPRKRRRQRTIHRVRFGVGLAGTLIIGTTFSALPVAEDFRNNTLELLQIIEPEDRVDEASADLDVATEQVPAAIDWDTSVWVDPRMVGVAPPTETVGLLTFRGSPTRSFYGTGPLPAEPEIKWRYPDEGGLCRQSTVGLETRTWCGTGWTGQPSIFERGDRLWTVFGALDGAVHFLDATTGEPVMPKFQTDDIIKGSVTIDPDGYPIVYSGSRDNNYRAIAFDGDEPRELWRMNADDNGAVLWNNDWDGAGLVLDDYLFVGGENSRIHIVKLNRSYDNEGLVMVDPAVVFSAPGWDADLLGAVGDNVSIENSVAISGDTLYFANSGGLIQGWDLSTLRDGGTPERVFRFWAGDDIDASIVVDAEGMLYAGVEFERNNARARDLGQLIKIDPTRSGDDAVVWSVQENQGINTGIWGTPAIYGDQVIFSGQGGRLRSVDKNTGEDIWEIGLGFHLWQSPVVVDDVLLMGNCSGVLRAFDLLSDSETPPELWALSLDDGCIESTPAVWNGNVVVGTRRGGVYGIGQAN